jgi:hypothetical protein
MTDPRIFPTILAALDFISAIAWAINGEPRKVIYWISAGVLTLSVTW